MSQRIREAERERKYEEYADREGDIVTGIIQQTDSRYTLLDLGQVEALLPQAEQVPYERPEPGARLKAYIVEVRKTAKGPQIVVSRTHPGLIKRLFELEVPEIADGVVEIKACAREPGHRTKIAVWSNDHNVDPVGACVGARGARVRMVVNELRGEKIDIVPFSEDPADFVAKALSPAKVKEVRIHEDTGTAEVIVPDYQLSLAIGKEGQNARLAARLTGWRVDIKSETQLADEEAYQSDEWARGRVGRRTPRPARWSGTPPRVARPSSAERVAATSAVDADAGCRARRRADAELDDRDRGRAATRSARPSCSPKPRPKPKTRPPKSRPPRTRPRSSLTAADRGPIRTCVGCRRRRARRRSWCGWSRIGPMALAGRAVRCPAEAPGSAPTPRPACDQASRRDALGRALRVRLDADAYARSALVARAMGGNRPGHARMSHRARQPHRLART